LRILACLFVLSVVVVASAKPTRPGPPEARPDQDLLQGDWTIVSAVKDNEDDSAGEAEQWTYTFKESQLLIHAKRPNLPTLDEKATFKIDSTKKPKRIDIVPPNPNAGGVPVSFNGIYELKGNTLRICKAIPGEARPTDFATKIGIVTLRRKNP
jgi:uncharacterized protein (TIGR03067 family)